MQNDHSTTPAQLPLPFEEERAHAMQKSRAFMPSPMPLTLTTGAAVDGHARLTIIEAALASTDMLRESTGCGLRAATDVQAIEAWINARCDTAADALHARVNHTARTYRREAFRFLLWLQVERGASLAGACLEDCVAYRDFLADPQPRDKWCAPVGAAIGSPAWRPFVSGLSARSRRQAMVVISGLYRFLQDQRYLNGNPVTGVSMSRDSAPHVDPRRSLTKGQWQAVAQVLDQSCAAIEDRRGRQLAWAVRFLRATGLRLAEIVAANCGDFEWVEFNPEPPDVGHSDPTPMSGAWILRVTGKGQKVREVPVPSDLVDELGRMLQADSDATSTDPRDHGARPLLLGWRSARTGRNVALSRRLSGPGLYRQLKQLFARVAMQLEACGRARDAHAVARASTHWLRHTHGVNAVASGVPIDVVQQNLGHGSLATTTIYTRGSLVRRAQESFRLK